jgi:antitoxin CptB
MAIIFSYMRRMPPTDDLKRLHWRATHRGTREADFLIGGFFDRHHASWDSDDMQLFAELLDEQDVDIMAWALGTQHPPKRFEGPMMQALQSLDYIPIAK